MYRINVARQQKQADGATRSVHFFAVEIDDTRERAAEVLVELRDRFPECDVDIDEVETVYHGVDSVKMYDEFRAARAERLAAEFAREEAAIAATTAARLAEQEARTLLLSQSSLLQKTPGAPLGAPLAVNGLRAGDKVTVEYPKQLSWRVRSSYIRGDRVHPMLTRTYTVESVGSGYTLGSGDNREQVAIFDCGNMRIEITSKWRAMGEVVMDGRRYRTRELYSKGKVVSVKCAEGGAA